MILTNFPLFFRYAYCVFMFSLVLSFVLVALTQAVTGLNVSTLGFNLQFMLWLSIIGSIKYFWIKRRGLRNEECKT